MTLYVVHVTYDNTEYRLPGILYDIGCCGMVMMLRADDGGVLIFYAEDTDINSSPYLYSTPTSISNKLAVIFITLHLIKYHLITTDFLRRIAPARIA